MDRRAFMLVAPALVVGGCVSVAGVAGPPAPAPVFRVGDRWVYNCSDGFRVPVTWVETHEVTTIDSTGIAVRVTLVGETMNYRRVELLESPGVLLVGAVYDDAETRRFKTPLTRYQFPLTSGASWSQNVDNYDELTQREDTVNRYVKVGGYEQVSTPAGTFDAVVMRILMSVNYNDPFRFPTQCNYVLWWSEKVGAMVRETKYATYLERGDALESAQIRAQNTVIQLTSFTRGAA
jgi:uncharacterized protein DUF3108